jgi:hypothetical protein
VWQGRRFPWCSSASWPKPGHDNSICPYKIQWACHIRHFRIDRSSASGFCCCFLLVCDLFSRLSTCNLLMLCWRFTWTIYKFHNSIGRIYRCHLGGNSYKATRFLGPDSFMCCQPSTAIWLPDRRRWVGVCFDSIRVCVQARVCVYAHVYIHMETHAYVCICTYRMRYNGTGWLRIRETGVQRQDYTLGVHDPCSHRRS